jgi:hypothetical protein
LKSRSPGYFTRRATPDSAERFDGIEQQDGT